MNKRSIYFLYLIAILPFLSGCFETKFQFKTVIDQDGSILRQTKIEGRGANLFNVPSGPGWEVKTWETKGSETVFPDTYYHVLAQGKFRPHEVISSDYQFNVDRQLKDLDEEGKKQLELAGVKPPYEQNLFSRNKIQVNILKGWLTQTFVYEEVFQTAGEIDILLSDIQEEIKKKNGERTTPLAEEELKELARLRLEDEYLSQIQFQSEVTIPGKIVSTNASGTEKGKAVWKFSMKDFQDNYSVYTLRVISRSLSPAGLIFSMGVGLFAFFVLVLLVIGIQKRKSEDASKRKKKN